MASIPKNKIAGNKVIWRISQKSKSRHRNANLSRYELEQFRNEDDLACLGTEIYWATAHGNIEFSPDFQSIAETSPNNVYDVWEESFVQLHQSLNTAELNTELEPVSARAFIASLKVLGQAFEIAHELPVPDVVISGDGGVDIEWFAGDKMVSIRIRKTAEAQDRIYSQNNEDFGSVEFSEENLKRALSQLL